MFARLKLHALAPVAALALWAVLLALWPGVAEAQETPGRANAPQAPDRAVGADHHVVVAPGDTLWSISEARHGPGATRTQIARGVDRIYALNRDLIGADPDTIYTGQRFALPRALGRHVPRQVLRQLRGPERAQLSSGADAWTKAAQTSQGVESVSERAAGPTAGKPAVGPAADPTGRAASASAADRALAIHLATHESSTLPTQAVVDPVPAVRSLAASGVRPPVSSYLDSVRAAVSSATSTLVGFVVTDERYAGRQLLGWTLMAASLGIGASSLALAMVRRRRKRSRHPEGYPEAGAAYAATPPESFAPLRAQEKHAGALGSVPSGGRCEGPPGPVNGGAAPGDYRKHTGVPSPRQGSPRGAEYWRMNRRRKVEGEDPTMPGAHRVFEIRGPLRRSLESLPLRPGALADRALAELRPQVEYELAYVALVESHRRLDDRERRQAQALRDLLAVIQAESPEGTRVGRRPPGAPV